jgi:plasmid stabilization system protein ParE
MRSIRLSQTALKQLNALLAQGVKRFGVRVVADKRDRVYATIERFLAPYPAAKKPDRNHGLRVYPISRTPFIVLYDFDDVELRIHFVFHAHADLRNLDPATVVW